MSMVYTLEIVQNGTYSNNKFHLENKLNSICYLSMHFRNYIQFTSLEFATIFVHMSEKLMKKKTEPTNEGRKRTQQNKSVDVFSVSVVCVSRVYQRYCHFTIMPYMLQSNSEPSSKLIRDICIYKNISLSFVRASAAEHSCWCLAS